MTRPDIASQRCFYDKHGYPSETLRQKELPDIFDWSPKFGIYEEEMLADEETTHVEEWMAAQVSTYYVLGSWHTLKSFQVKSKNYLVLIGQQFVVKSQHESSFQSEKEDFYN